MPTTTPVPLAACALVLAACNATLSRSIEEFRRAHGEFYEGATVRPPVRLSVASVDEAELDGEDGSFDLDDVELDALVPIPLGRDAFLIGGLVAIHRSYDFDGTPVADDDVGIYGLRLGYGRFLNDDLGIQAYWEPSVYSDFDESLEARDYRLWYGTVLAVGRSRPDLFWKLGVRVTDALDTGAIPLVGFVKHFENGLHFETLLPRDATLVWRPTPEWILSGGMENHAYEIHVRGPEGLGSPEHDVHTQESVLFLQGERIWGGHLSTFARVGVPIGGTYDWGYGGGFPDYEGDLDSGTLVAFGLAYRF